MTNDTAFCIYMDRMSMMPERFKTLKEAAENWPTVSSDVRNYYDDLAKKYLNSSRES